MPPVSYTLYVLCHLTKAILLNVYAVGEAESAQTACVTAANSIELPVALMTIEFTDNDCCLNGEVLAEIETDEFLICGLINYPYECVLDLTEVLAANVSIIDSNCECDLGDILRHQAELLETPVSVWIPAQSPGSILKA